MDFKKIVVSAVIAGIVAFFWGSISWMVLPWHTMTVNNIQNETAVVDAMRTSMTKTGVYVFPSMPDEMTEENWNTFTEKYKQGPVGVIHYLANGFTPMGPSVMLTGLLLQILSFGLAAFILSMVVNALPTFQNRLVFIVLLGTLAFATVHCQVWNWMCQPLDYTIIMILDGIVSYVLAGSVIAAIIKPAAQPA